LALRQLQQISAVLPAWEIPAVDPRLSSRLSARLAQHQQPTGWRQRVFSLQRLAWAGVTIVAIAGMLYIGFRSPHRPVPLAQREESHVASIIVPPSSETAKNQMNAPGVIATLQPSSRIAHHGRKRTTKHIHAPVGTPVLPVDSPPDAGSAVMGLLTEAPHVTAALAPPADMTVVMMASSPDDPALAVVSCLTETK
jgi:hypothetical protein